MTKKEYISSTQLFTLLFVITVSDFILNPDTCKDQGYAALVFAGMMIFCLLSFLTVYFSDHYRKKASLSSPKTVNSLWIFGFIYLSVYHLYTFAHFIEKLNGNIIPSLPIIFLLFISAAYSAFKGIEATARFSAIVFISIILFSILYFVFLYPSYRPENISSFSSGINGNKSFFAFITLFEEFTVMLLLSRNTKGNYLRSGMIWNVLQTVFLISFLILIAGSLGEYLIEIYFPVFHASDGVGSLQRFRPFFVSVTIGSLFCTLSTEFYLIYRFTAEMIRDKSSIRRKNIFVFSTVFILYLIISSFPGLYDVIYDLKLMTAVILISVFVLPVLTLFSSRIRRTNIVRTAGLLVLLLSCAIISSGCNSNQLNQRIIVQGIGIDRNDDSCLVTLIALDTDSRQTGNQVQLIYSNGKTVENALIAAEKRQGKKLLLSQCLFLMLNKDAAYDTEDTLSYFIDNNDIMKTTNIMVSDKAEEMLTNAINELDYTSEKINVLSDSNAINQSAYHFSIFDYVNVKNGNAKEIFIPYIIEDKKLKCLRTDDKHCLRLTL